MKKLISTLQNIWKIEDLRQRILITVLFVAIYRFGSKVLLPGISYNQLDELRKQTASGLMSLLDMFSGGAFSNASIFALGIMPYISASIVMQLLAVAVPYFQKMQREGESGRKKIMMYTRYLTVGILLFQAPSYLVNLQNQIGPAFDPGVSTGVVKTTILNIGLKSLHQLVHQSVSAKIRTYHSLSDLCSFEGKVIVRQFFCIVADVMKQTKRCHKSIIDECA